MAPRHPSGISSDESLDAAALNAVDEAARAIAGLLDIEEALQLIVERVRTLVGARYAALGIVGADDRIQRFITSGMSHLQREAIGPLPRGRGLLGLIIREGSSYRIPDIAAHPGSSGFPANHPPMTSFLGVPVTSRGRSIGNFYLTDKAGATEFTADDQRLVELFALHAGIAIDNARLHQQAAEYASSRHIENLKVYSFDPFNGPGPQYYGLPKNIRIDEIRDTLLLRRPDPGTYFISSHRFASYEISFTVSGRRRSTVPTSLPASSPSASSSDTTRLSRSTSTSIPRRVGTFRQSAEPSYSSSFANP